MSIENRIKKIVATSMCVGEDTITMSTSFDKDLGCDSLDLVEMAMSVEDEFDIDIPDSDAQSFGTVSDLINYVGTAVAA
jgi:acyl carrier protein